METFFKNPTFTKQAGLMAAAAAAVACGALASGGGTCGAWALAAGAACLSLFAFFSYGRYREIERLAAEIDRVLHDGRTVNLSDYREGDVAVLRNEVGKACARLVRTAEALEAEKRALGDALADISHQIRTPMTAIELMVPVIDRSPDERERRAKLRELEGMVDRVSWLVTSLLKMARIDAGAVSFAARPQKARPVLEAAVAPLAVALNMRGIECRIHADDEAEFTGDAAWTAEAVSNVVKNCMEHTPDGGRIELSAREDAVACRISIQDSGAGIAEEDLAHIFERFYRGGSANAASRKNEAEEAADYAQAMRPAGFGIGLSLCRSLIDAQGGIIRAGNAEGGGARFDIVFPKVTV